MFDNLSRLVAGDTIYVQDVDGSSTTFVVRHIQTYGQLDVAPEIFYSSDGKAHLNLITCGGLWNKVTKRYPDRIVVFTDKI